MARMFEYNQKVLRKYLRVLSVHKSNNSYIHKDIDNAIKFMTIVHNLIKLEDRYYDIVMMNNLEVNRHLILSDNAKSVSKILQYFYAMFDRRGKVRQNVEKLHQVDEIRYILTQEKDYLKKLDISR